MSLHVYSELRPTRYKTTSSQSNCLGPTAILTVPSPTAPLSSQSIKGRCPIISMPVTNLPLGSVSTVTGNSHSTIELLDMLPTSSCLNLLVFLFPLCPLSYCLLVVLSCILNLPQIQPQKGRVLNVS